MSIFFTEVRYKNLLSTGNAWTTIELNKSKSTLIVGTNGAGKSTMLDAISFALYGKAFRKINKPQLINSINQKDLMVEVKFTAHSASFVIRRGMRPNIFEIWKNDILINQDASSRDYQQYLEESILKMNYKSFGQVVVLGSSTFVPFMQLPAASRREVIEDLLDIQIFSTMNTLLKERINVNKTDTLDIKYKIDLVRNNISAARDHNESIRRIREDEVTRIRSKMKEQIAIVERDTGILEVKTTTAEELNSTVANKATISTKRNDFRILETDLKSKYNSVKRDIKFYTDHDNCPTCQQGIEHDFKTETLKNKQDKQTELETALEQLSAKISDIDLSLEQIYDIERNIQKINLHCGELRANIKIAMATLQTLKAEHEGAKKTASEIDTAKIVEYEALLERSRTIQSDLLIDRDTLIAVASMLKDGGIKTRIIKQYVPIMNKLINKYLAAMDFFVDFQLDESFNEKILSRFRDEFSYASFSEGEKLRIDLSLMFCWRAVSKLRNSVTTNLLLMDEVLDGSLDNAGTEEFLRIINELTADSNVFIISHKGDTLYDKFDNVIKFKKVKNFSIMDGETV